MHGRLHNVPCDMRMCSSSEPMNIVRDLGLDTRLRSRHGNEGTILDGHAVPVLSCEKGMEDV